MRCFIAVSVVSLAVVPVRSWADEPVVVATWEHRVTNKDGSVNASVIKLYSNGHINQPDGKNTWVRKGDTLTLRWPNPKAPGGAWEDVCKVSADGKSFTGRNQIGTTIAGKLVSEAVAAKPPPRKEPAGKGSEPGPGASTAGTASKEKRGLVGVWEVTGMEASDEPPRRPGQVSLVWTVKADGTIDTYIPTLKSGSNGWKYKADASTDPPEIDLTVADGPAANTLFKGIYKIDGDVLTVGIQKGTTSEAGRLFRPASFNVAIRDDLYVYKFKWVAAGRPGFAGVKPDPKDEFAVAATVLSDDFTVGGLPAAGKRDATDLARVMASKDRAIAALAKDAQAVAIDRARMRLATRAWERGVAPGGGEGREAAANLAQLFASFALDDGRGERNFYDEFVAAMQASKTNDLRIAAHGALQNGIRKVQTGSLPAALKERYPKARPDDKAVTLSVTKEQKLPAEMALVNTGSGTLHNVVVWYAIEMGPIPGLTAEQERELEWAKKAGFKESVDIWKENRLKNAAAVALGSRNIVFIPELKPKDEVRITYELGTIRWSKRAVFSLYSDEVKVVDKDVAGVREMREDIEKRYGGR